MYCTIIIIDINFIANIFILYLRNYKDDPNFLDPSYGIEFDSILLQWRRKGGYYSTHVIKKKGMGSVGRCLVFIYNNNKCIQLGI